MLGDAHGARQLLLQTPAPTPPGAPSSGGEAEGRQAAGGEAEGLPPLVLACLRGDAAYLEKERYGGDMGEI